MKLTPEEKLKIVQCSGDWERYHCEYDALMERKLSELDPELSEDFQELREKGTFWYA